MADSTVTIVGNLTRDPELRYTGSGRSVATFGVAVNRRWQNRQSGEWEEQVSFFNISAWGDLGENAAASLPEGHPRHRHRPPRAAQLRDPAGREALRGRDRRRRDRPQPPLGDQATVNRTERTSGEGGGGQGGGGGSRPVANEDQGAPAYTSTEEEPF